MRNLILGLSIACLALSGLITFKALNLPEKGLRNPASQPPIKIQESSQIAKDTALKPAENQAPETNINQTLQNTISHLEQKLEDQIADYQGNIRTLEDMVKQLEQKLAAKIVDSQTNTQATKNKTSQLKQKLANQIADSQENIQILENTVKQLEQKLADKIADSQTNTQATKKTTSQLEQKLADQIADSQGNIRTLENTVKQLEQKLTDTIAESQKDTRSAKNTTAQLEQKLADKIADSQENIQTLENTVKQLERKLADKIAGSRTDSQTAKNTIARPKQKTAPLKNTTQNISKIGKPENTEKLSGPLLFSVSFNSGQFVIKDSTKKIIQQYTQYIRSLPYDYRLIVEGHTDSSPLKIISRKKYPFKDNMDLSLFRAEIVADMFKKEGVLSKRISAIGYGATRPIATNENEEGRAKNRRVVVRLIPEEKEI